ncbi:4-(cytidine 5'-diphospho)-2-C-methyl-D-erythritol kinase [Roseivivax sediminis]|uniref:4-diphosphocytidyl-2-C-methyl-D-erythritol kinase n=1 Tax=Roseivivax sediminis TaxID=936889 RepID=A0A1I2DXH3_9RHOB|nr:4-(cytidine 5'-diphospho)-2-C-methyl-D-erythritol kinase [Roseivivax sediminis]SFE85354.1 4-diphosphocytidyl-2-C-methyl-D-erythritol kinase [Roseivivax sediminis]
MKVNEALAPAKVNLTLHVTGRRDDGYHLLDSLVVFADLGDHLRAGPADDLTLEVTGPMAAGVSAGPDNLVLRAARHLHPSRGARLTLDKHLPAAAGIGGGSSDAAAALRVLSRLWDLPLPGDCVVLGADVPVCLDPVAQRLSGIGERHIPAPGLPPLPAVLVNPGIAASTPAVFAALENRTNSPMPSKLPRLDTPREVASWLATQRNDLTAPARTVAPVIERCLSALHNARLARMSGSGATCFGLYDTRSDAEAAAKAIAQAEPDWWVREVTLNPPPSSSR